MTIKTTLKKIYLKTLFVFPHGNVYMFHHVTEKPRVEVSNCKINSEQFKEFIDKHSPYVKPIEFFKNSLSNIITFDDGAEDVFTIAFPYLKEKNIPFAVFVTTDCIDKAGYLNRAQILEMEESGLVTFGSHLVNHIKISKVSYEEKRNELIKSKQTLESLLNDEIKMVAYPYGDYDQETLEIAKEAGYEYGFQVAGRPVFKHRNNFCIKRMSITTDTRCFYEES